MEIHNFVGDLTTHYLATATLNVTNKIFDRLKPATNI